MNRIPDVSIVTSDSIDAALYEAVLSLCSQAYEGDFSAYLQLMSPATHVLGYIDGELVTHAAWVQRELRVVGLGSLRSAYVEAVATLPSQQGNGYARAVLERIPSLVGDFELAALSPSNADYYRPLGWELWQGPLSYRSPSGIEIATPDEQVMIRRLPNTPPALDIASALSTDWRPLEVW